MHEAKNLKFVRFDSESNQLKTIPSKQSQYLHAYLHILGSSVIVEEQNYFDRDYLDEFSSFYSLSSRGYVNVCRRLHFFSSDQVNYELFKRAAGGDEQAEELLQNSYLGFCIIRPIPTAKLGRTILKWFPDNEVDTPRITSPSREYICNIVGITLKVVGLAWQQQDRGVGACATIGLWSTLHSSAFDDHHSIPTTAEITKSAHEGASLGSRIFPASGLTMYQVMEAIKAQRLAPIWFASDIEVEVEIEKGNAEEGNAKKKQIRYKLINGFSKERFLSTCASFVRSGYPVLIWCEHLDSKAIQKHIICAVGFRESPPQDIDAGKFSLQDEGIKHLYIHDDNLGPNVRFKIKDNGFNKNGDPLPVTIIADPPDSAIGDDSLPTLDYPEIRPEALCVAVHECIRISPDTLHDHGKQITKSLCLALNAVYRANNIDEVSLSFSTRIIKLSDYIGEELGRLLSGSSNILSQVRMDLYEKVPPMSLHIGVVRIANSNSTPLVDIIFDTTDTDLNCPIFSHMVFNDTVDHIFTTQGAGNFGTKVKAY